MTYLRFHGPEKTGITMDGTREFKFAERRCGEQYRIAGLR